MTHVRTRGPIRPAIQGGQHIPTAAVFLIWFANVLTVWSHRAQSRKLLRNLSEGQLDDVGISRAQAEAESLKRFWMP